MEKACWRRALEEGSPELSGVQVGARRGIWSVRSYRPTSFDFELARSRFREACRSFGYTGWSDDIDRSYDLGSRVFALYKDGSNEMLASIRLILSRAGRLPCFQAIGARPDRTHERDLAEVNSLWFHKSAVFGLPLLFEVASIYTCLTSVEKAYCLQDTRNHSVARIHQRSGFRHASEFPEPVVFPGFRSSGSAGASDDVRWLVLEMDRERFLSHALQVDLEFLLFHEEAVA